MKKILVLFLGAIILLYFSTSPNIVIYEASKIIEAENEVIISKVEILSERSDSLKVKVHYDLLTKDTQDDVEIWVAPNHSNSVFEWSAVYAYDGKNVVSLEMNLRKDTMKELGIQSANSDFLRVIVNLRSDHWFEKEIPFIKQWKLN